MRPSEVGTYVPLRCLQSVWTLWLAGLFSPRDILKNPTAATERLAHGDQESIRLRPWPQMDKPKTRWKGKATWK